MEQRIESLSDMTLGHEARIRLLEMLMERAIALQEELRRDNVQTRRLWVKLAERYGWTDDDGLFSDPT